MICVEIFVNKELINGSNVISLNGRDANDRNSKNGNAIFDEKAFKAENSS